MAIDDVVLGERQASELKTLALNLCYVLDRFGEISRPDSDVEDSKDRQPGDRIMFSSHKGNLSIEAAWGETGYDNLTVHSRNRLKYDVMFEVKGGKRSVVVNYYDRGGWIDVLDEKLEK